MIAEVPNAIMIPAHPRNYSDEERTTYDLIVIHCTDGRELAANVAHMWTRGDLKKRSSAHFVVGQAGELVQCVRLRHVAFHAHEANERSIGIEHCARTPGEFERPPVNWRHDPGLPPSEALYATSARLTAWLLMAAGLPVDRAHVRGHAEVDSVTSHRKCPTGCGWDWERYMGLVQGAHDALRAQG